MIDPEEHPELLPLIDEDEEREYQLAMQNLQERLFAEEEGGSYQVDKFESDAFALALLEAMSAPIDPNSLPPSNNGCGLRIEIERAESEAAD